MAMRSATASVCAHQAILEDLDHLERCRLVHGGDGGRRVGHVAHGAEVPTDMPFKRFMAKGEGRIS